MSSCAGFPVAFITRISLKVYIVVPYFPLKMIKESLKGSSARIFLIDQQVVYNFFDWFSVVDDFPKPIIIKDPQSQIALKDGTLNLTCTAATSSDSQLKIDWKKDHVVNLKYFLHTCNVTQKWKSLSRDILKWDHEVKWFFWWILTYTWFL